MVCGYARAEAPVSAFARSERAVRYEIESGIRGTRNMEIHGYE